MSKHCTRLAVPQERSGVFNALLGLSDITYFHFEDQKTAKNRLLRELRLCSYGES
jgi:hypothetical protein